MLVLIFLIILKTLSPITLLFNFSFSNPSKYFAKMLLTPLVTTFRNRFLAAAFMMALAFFLTPASLHAQTAPLTVHITSVKSDKGKMMFALFHKADGFPGTHQKAFQLKETKTVKGTTTVTFENLPAGTYALAVFHDENSDGKLNTNVVGIPREPYGFSNNARSAFSAPSFKDASFRHDKAQTISITIK
jgi:uncharacterized protein (DUF2141 family)